MAHDVTFIPGDGTGPELTEATRRVLEATGVDSTKATLQSLKTTRVGIKGPTTTPVGSGFRSINVLLRKELAELGSPGAHAVGRLHVRPPEGDRRGTRAGERDRHRHA